MSIVLSVFAHSIAMYSCLIHLDSHVDVNLHATNMTITDEYVNQLNINVNFYCIFWFLVYPGVICRESRHASLLPIGGE